MVFIFNQNVDSKTYKDTLLNTIGKEDYFITDSLEVCSLLKSIGIEGEYLYHISTTIWNKTIDFSLDWLIKINNFIPTDPYLKKNLFYDELCLWHFIYDALFEVSGGFFDAILYFTIFQEILGRLTFKQIIILGVQGNIAQNNLINLLKQSDYYFDVIIETKSLANLSPFSQSNRFIKYIKKGAYWFDNLFIKKMLYGISSLFNKNQVKNYTAFFCHHGNRSRVVRFEKEQVYLTDVIYLSIEKKIRKINSKVKTISLLEPQISSNQVLNKLKNWLYILQGVYIPWYSQISFLSLLKLIKYRSLLKDEVKHILSYQPLCEQFSIGKYNFLSGCQDKVLELLPALLTATKSYIEISAMLVKKEKISKIYTVESHSGLGRAFALALHQNGGELVGIQGGIITPFVVTNSGFYINKMTSGNKGLLPDEFWIWGQYYYNLLEKQYGYPISQLIIKGNINFSAPNVYDLCRDKYEPKFILYVASSNINVFPIIMSVDEEIYTIKKIAMLIPSDYTLLVRLHPSHPMSIFHQSFIGYSNISVHSASSCTLEDDFSKTNLIITKASSVLFDALIFNKFLILVNLAQTPEFTGVQEALDFSFLAQNESSLNDLINNFLIADKKTIELFNSEKHKLLSLFTNRMDCY